MYRPVCLNKVIGDPNSYTPKPKELACMTLLERKYELEWIPSITKWLTEKHLNTDNGQPRRANMQCQTNQQLLESIYCAATKTINQK